MPTSSAPIRSLKREACGFFTGWALLLAPASTTACEPLDCPFRSRKYAHMDVARRRRHLGRARGAGSALTWSVLARATIDEPILIQRMSLAV